MQLLVHVIALAIFQFHVVSAGATASFLPTNFVSWFWQSSIVFEDWLYIDGGEIWARWNGLSTDASREWNQQTIAIDLSTSWDISLQMATTIVTNKTTALSPTREPDLYYDPKDGVVYAIGGDAYQLNSGPYNTSVPVQRWGFTPGDGHANWELQDAGTSQTFPLTSNVAGGLTATSPQGHYNLGGYISFDQGGTVGQLALADMVNFNFANQSWYNQTNPDHFLWGEAQYIPTFGQDGVILFLGGKSPSDANVVEISFINDLDTILVYDIHSNTFFKQPATNAPLGRFSFCSVAAGTNASANSSYKIFIYGGTTGLAPDSNTQEELSAVHILTLPAFNWISTPADVTWRAYHTCSIIGNRQMISIGGIGGQESFDAWTDPWTNGLGTFDLTALNWTNAYDHTAAPYKLPDVVTTYYLNRPRYSASWSDPALQAIFQTDAGTTTTAGATTTPSPQSSNTGAIAGGVAGGVAAIEICVVVFCVWRQKRRYGGRSSEVQGPAELDSNVILRAELPGRTEISTSSTVIHEVLGSEKAVCELPSQS